MDGVHRRWQASLKHHAPQIDFHRRYVFMGAEKLPSATICNAKVLAQPVRAQDNGPGRVRWRHWKGTTPPTMARCPIVMTMGYQCSANGREGELLETS